MIFVSPSIMNNLGQSALSLMFDNNVRHTELGMIYPISL